MTVADHNCMVEILLDIFPDDEVSREQYRHQMEAEVRRRFEQPKVRAAVHALVAELMCKGVVEGPEAEAIIDQRLHG